MQPSAQPPTGARRVRVPPARLARWLTGFAEQHGTPSTETTPDTVTLIGADGARAWLTVPFPPLVGDPALVGDAPLLGDPALLGAPPLLGDLVEHVERARLVGVLLVRRGGHAVGVFRGDELCASKVGSGYVQGTTKAGGWSQQRYARRRANQASAVFAKAATAAAEILLDPALEALVVGGDRAAVKTVLADQRLAPLAALQTPPFLGVPDPRKAVLAATPDQFRAVRIALDP